MVEINRDTSLVWKGTYPVRAGEIDPHGHVTLDTICNFLQESAGQHAHALGVSVPQLLPENLTWVLARLRVQMRHLAGWHDVIAVETWPAGAEMRYALRDFRLFDQNRRLLGIADTGWMMIDLAKKRPIRLADEIRKLYPAEMGRAFAMPFAKLPALQHAQHEKAFAVRFRDLDLNRHVNNVSYIVWLLESAPPELLFRSTPAGWKSNSAPKRCTVTACWRNVKLVQKLAITPWPCTGYYVRPMPKNWCGRKRAGEKLTVDFTI